MRCDIYSLLRHRLVILAVVAVTGTVGISSADQPESDPYPLRICVILDCELDDGAEVLYAGDREIRVCCQQCVNEFSDAWIDVIDEQIIEQQTPFYPVKTCVVDGKRLDDFNATKKVVGNRLFCLCSNDCCKAVEQQSGKYFGLLNKAVIKQQKLNYPLARCVVSGGSHLARMRLTTLWATS